MNDTRILFISEVSRILGINPYEKNYIKKFCNRENLELPTKVIHTDIDIKYKKLNYKNSRCVLKKTFSYGPKNGIKNEHCILNHIKNEVNIVDYQKSYRKMLNTKIKFCLYGKIDGLLKFKDNQYGILEIKIRNKTAGIRQQDYVQIQMYLFISNLDKSLIAEHCDENINIYYIHKDETFINEILDNITELINSCDHKR